MKKRISNPLIAALVSIIAISGLTLMTSPSGAIRDFTFDEDIVCETSSGPVHFAVIAYAAADPARTEGNPLGCGDLQETSKGYNQDYKYVSDCTGSGFGVCNRDDVTVIQLEDLQNADTDHDCIEPDGEMYEVNIGCNIGWPLNLTP